MRKEAIGFSLPEARFILTLASLLLVASSSASPRRPPWWEVRVLLTARGDYTVKGSGTAYTGEFFYRAQWDGTMEPDGRDFILYHTRTEPQAWEVREKAALPGRARILTEKDVADEPCLRMNYVLRQEDEILLDFEVDGVRVPLHAAPRKLELILPRSREHARDPTRYDEFGLKGSNRVLISESDLKKPHSEKSFSWEWRRQQWVAADNAVLFLASFHKALVTVTLICHE